MRYFIALEVPEESKQELAKVQQLLKQVVPDANFTDPEKLHLTIAFVGEQPPELSGKLKEIMLKSTQNIKPFKITPAYIDGFPTLHNAKILWAGVKGEIDKLFVLRERIKDGMVSLNLDVDERRFVPHIALAKLKHFYLNKSIEQTLQEMMLKNFEEIEVSSIKLFESVPDKGLHTHNTLAEIKLG